MFASQLHTHMTGQRVRTMHIRDGLQLKDLNGDKHYSPHFQEIRLLQEPVKVLPVRSLFLLIKPFPTMTMSILQNLCCPFINVVS